MLLLFLLNVWHSRFAFLMFVFALLWFVSMLSL